MNTRDGHMRFAMARHARVRIAEFPRAALGKIVGRVRAHMPLAGPVSGRACAYWEVSCMCLRDGVWYEYHRWRSGNPFYVIDESGEALVDVHWSDALLLPDHDVRGRVGTAAGMFEVHRQWEGVLQHGEPVAVLGYGVFEHDPNPLAQMASYCERPVTLVLRGSSKQPVLITDKPTIVGRA